MKFQLIFGLYCCIMLLSLITFESLARKGLVRVYRENYTLGDDMGEKIVVEKL